MPFIFAGCGSSLIYNYGEKMNTSYVSEVDKKDIFRLEDLVNLVILWFLFSPILEGMTCYGTWLYKFLWTIITYYLALSGKFTMWCGRGEKICREILLYWAYFCFHNSATVDICNCSLWLNVIITGKYLVVSDSTKTNFKSSMPREKRDKKDGLWELK